MYPTEKEEDLTNLLIEIGTKKNVARVLVFLANIPEATSKDVERNTDLRTSEVRNAMRYLIRESWIISRESKMKSRGRTVRIFGLSKPFHEIIDCIEKERKEKVINQLAIIQKLQYRLR